MVVPQQAYDPQKEHIFAHENSILDTNMFLVNTKPFTSN